MFSVFLPFLRFWAQVSGYRVQVSGGRSCLLGGEDGGTYAVLYKAVWALDQNLLFW